LEEGEEILCDGIKGGMGIFRLIYVLVGNNTHQSVLKNLKLIESSIVELEEHQSWKYMICLDGSSIGLS
jgi:hypothetical protein